MGDLASWVGVVIASGSLVVAIIALLKRSRAQQEAKDVQRRLVAIEEQRESERRAQAQRAVLRPALCKTGSADCRLYLSNAGPVEARNVKVLLNGKPLNEHPAALPNDTLPALIGPESQVSCPMVFAIGTPLPPFEIEITWEDDSGHPGLYKGMLTF